MPKKYRKKPVVIEALQVIYGKTELLEVEKFIGSSDLRHQDPLTGKEYIRTLEGDMLVSDGDYIIKGIQGEFYPCKPDIFEATYERYQGVAYRVKVTDTAVFKSVLSRVSDLIEQVELSDFKDENGHELKMNKAYSDLFEAIGLQRVAD